MSTTVTVSTFYSFVSLDAPDTLRAPILECMRALDIRGTITLAPEGINATISGAGAAIEQLMAFLASRITFTTPTFRESYIGTQPFKRSKVKVKRELISLGVPTFPAACVGQYVRPEDWNALITAPNVIIIDTRNDYEFAMGHFVSAINPATRNFKQMVAWTEANLALPSGRASKIAMYCTGGIRCEKYSSYLVARGFTDVYHLHGGILAYLEHIPAEQSLWQGSCYVFDERVSVGQGLVASFANAA
ncbi:MAG: rhodanese domain-containing protein [Rickettsiales bacterium]|nr:rhodanese domain-containing protein [Rickettsiales bacterium]